MSIFQLISALQSFDVVAEGETAVRANTGKAIELNIDQQRRGVDAYGKSLPRYRTRKYAQVKHDRNPRPPFGVWDLWLTGAFQSAFKAGVSSGRLVILSTDDKYDKITDRAPDIFGLNDESKVRYNNENLVPDIQKAFNKKTGI